MPKKVGTVAARGRRIPFFFCRGCSCGGLEHEMEKRARGMLVGWVDD